MKFPTLLIYAALLLLILLTVSCECKQKKGKKSEKQVQSRETNIFNFLRILFLRLVYGIATSLGFGESISNFWGGAFVPPGVQDDYDDYGFDDDF
ncbi:hypothetical protein R5R35_004324 [Gryllus longicercus]|uniref:Uncharacterized protein n=1 Tax=Gryllus longicercus TaxID=2509291 RepID=A0AAN9VSK3_9ORTH|nr:Uncharacterized protein GBIM_07605 [Gryllus bimaculatus]